MSTELNLSVTKQGQTVESILLSGKEVCIKQIVPPRDPDRASEQEKVWVIDFEKRQNLVRRVDTVLDQHGTKRDQLLGYFDLMGLAYRWEQNSRVEFELSLKKTND